MGQETMEKKLLDVKEMAEYLRIKVPTLYSWVNQRRIPYIKIGHLVRFDPKQIDRWLEEQSIKTNDLD